MAQPRVQPKWLFPVCLVTSLFFLWGFSYGLLDTLNKHFQDTLGIGKSRSAGLQAAYFGAYPLASLGHAAWTLQRFGYRVTFVWGLCLFGLGAVLAIPAIKSRSFGGFCACIFVIGSGLGSLETAANPFMGVCGPARQSEIRLNVAQAFSGVGSVIAPVIGSFAFFRLDAEGALRNVQWIYLAVALLVFVLAAIFFVSDIPEPREEDADLLGEKDREAEEGRDQGHDDGGRSLTSSQRWRLFHAASAQFCCTGAQIAIAGYFINYVMETRPLTRPATASQLLAGAQGAFALGRFVGALLMRWIRPRLVLFVFTTLSTALVMPSIWVRGDAAPAIICLAMFFESVCFPTIVALGIRGLGRHSRRGSGAVVDGEVEGEAVGARREEGVLEMGRRWYRG
ncbi:Major facilitator superfamily domain, general substrate transporter [Ophiocordyceps camponoti-floridani]|uniref:Major facilitator superfamily domain, general substrate transporter n=1 Tax=Ophiocordyceps camponoti-floridani TaxID=2030778 RepID=A0A8H4QEC5_9HYPO|nr:Major facilitator superfamily domain, general substrate transporter [Ophiocordyceps camponoti-floridani]